MSGYKTSCTQACDGRIVEQRGSKTTNMKAGSMTGSETGSWAGIDTGGETRSETGSETESQMRVVSMCLDS